MNINENHKRARDIVQNWPDWKKDVSLTRHSNSHSCATYSALPSATKSITDTSGKK